MKRRPTTGRWGGPSDWLRVRLDVLNRASEGGWFDATMRTTRNGEGGRNSAKRFWEAIYARAGELEGLAGVRTLVVAYWSRTTNKLAFRARTPSDGDHL